MEVINQKKNPLMNREEAWIRIDHSGKPTPPRKDIIADVAKQFKAKEDCVIVDKIFSEAGIAASRVKVLVYPKSDAVPKAKMDKMKIRMGLMKKMKKGEAAPAAQDGQAAQAPPAPEGAKPGEGKPEEKKDESRPDEKPAEEKSGDKKDEKPAEKPAEGKKEEKSGEGDKA